MPFFGLFSPWSRRVATVAVLAWWAFLVWQDRAQFQALGEQAGLPRLAAELKCGFKNGASAPEVCPKEFSQSNQQRQE